MGLPSRILALNGHVALALRCHVGAAQSLGRDKSGLKAETSAAASSVVLPPLAGSHLELAHGGDAHALGVFKGAAERDSAKPAPNSDTRWALGFAGDAPS